MSQRPSGYLRQADDHYSTPRWVVETVIPYLRKHCLHIWAPADAQDSKLVQALRDEKFDVIATKDDFLVKTSLPYTRIDGICSNPPYGLGGRLPSGSSSMRWRSTCRSSP